MAPPKPKSAKEARLKEMFKKMGKDKKTLEELEKQENERFAKVAMRVGGRVKMT